MKAILYAPPYTMTPEIVRLVATISEIVGRFTATADVMITPRLRRENRIRSIQGSLAIEQNSLSLGQVTAVIQGRRVLGSPREIQEVRNAFAAYEALPSWSPVEMNDLLAAHRILVAGLVDEPGAFRRGGIGVFRDQQVLHVAPPVQRVPKLMADLLNWLKTTPEHSLIAGCIFHYELESIHPFADGNGRMGRLWQTLILSKWQPWLAFVPVESVIRERQEAYYQALRQSDQQAEATRFIVFMLEALRDALAQLASDQASDHVTDQVRSFLRILSAGDMTLSEAMKKLSLAHRPTFRSNYVHPALKMGLVEMTQPAAPRSPTQRYHLTMKGRSVIEGLRMDRTSRIPSDSRAKNRTH
ncbi:MAG: Fic family protein [Proteobacteria bacterium]|nr:Fic family protein [Pseudomonadota bacterium]